MGVHIRRRAVQSVSESEVWNQDKLRTSSTELKDV